MYIQVGHDGDFGRRYVANVTELCAKAQVVRTVKAIGVVKPADE